MEKHSRVYPEECTSPDLVKHVDPVGSSNDANAWATSNRRSSMKRVLQPTEMSYVEQPPPAIMPGDIPDITDISTEKEPVESLFVETPKEPKRADAYKKVLTPKNSLLSEKIPEEDGTMDEPLSDVESEDFDLDAEVVAAYWMQLMKEGEVRLHSNQPSREEIKKEVEQILRDKEYDTKDKVFQEVKFIISRFRQRRCKNYCHKDKKMVQLVKRMGININSNSKEFCVCGLPKDYHSDDAKTARVNKWSIENNTEMLYPYTFGNMDIPGHYNYLETPEGTRKYIRFDDMNTDPADMWQLLTEHWNLQSPNMVISVTGGDVKHLYENSSLQQAFEEGILKSAVTTKSWILTDGFHHGASREISDIFQEHLPRSQWAEHDDHANIALIGISPWGVVADRKNLNGIYVGSDESIYLYTSSVEPNALDPFHVIYLMPDDGTSGRYDRIPQMRIELERYIRQNTSLNLVGAQHVSTPVVILVLGGDQFTLEHLANALSEDNQFSVVIVNDSGPVASMLAEVFQKLESVRTRGKDAHYGWSEDEQEDLTMLITKFEGEGMLKKPKDKEHLGNIMKARHLIEVFGIGERDTHNLDKAILEAIFGGTQDISMQLTLTLAMDRHDVAASDIFVESRKKELKVVSDTLQEVLLVSMETGRKKFVELLLDQDYGGELDFKKLLTVERLYRLHVSNLDPSKIMGKVLRTMCRRKTDGSYLLNRSQLLPQIGRVIHTLLGHNYRLLYQENEYREVGDKEITYRLTQHAKEEPVWHLFLWAVLANQKEMAEVFLFETSCKIGGALIAYELFSEMAKKALVIAESQLATELMASAEYFQTLAIEVLENLYEFDRDEAYSAVTSVIPFRLSRYVTPLHIADDAEATRFMGHACCQTLLNRIWYQYMDLDTRGWKLFPLFALFPVNLAFIVFDRKNLNYGTYRTDYKEKIKYQSTVTNMNRTRRDTEREQDKEQIIESDKADKSEKEGKANSQSNNTSSEVWFKLKNYYTSPVNKFMLYFTFWLIFLGFFTHFLLSELRPINKLSEVTVWEWLLISWITCITLDELKQLLFFKSSGPLYQLDWQELEPSWSDTWYLHERLFFVLRLYKFTNWIEDNWNKVDFTMVTFFWVSVICRHTVNHADFMIVRILFAVTIIFFYYRILRLGYIIETIGPRVITIQHMIVDLMKFFLILLIFIIGFGVAFQAVLSPNSPTSVVTLVDVIWRPYWQMFGELFTDDTTTEMGRPVSGPACTYNRSLSLADPLNHPYCYSWVAPVLLGVFMLITNILLLNLLIAIFSNSFNKIETEALTIWRYHIYDLVHEYYHHVWLPPPLNIFCHLINFFIWLFRWPRKWAYQDALRRHMKRLRGNKGGASLIARGPETMFLEASLLKQAKEAIKQDCCYNFYYDEEDEIDDDISHLLQPEIMRDDDLEEKAYKRHLRKAHKEKEKNLRKMMGTQNEKLMQILADLQGLREQAKDPIANADQLAGNKAMGKSHNKKQMDRMEERMTNLDRKLEGVLRHLEHGGHRHVSKRLTKIN